MTIAVVQEQLLLYFCQDNKYNMMAARQGTQAKKVEHWTISEEMRYHFFLVLHYRKFAQGKAKIQNIFKDMEKFLGKESTKCRSHHQKRMKGHSSVADLLRAFYQNFYKIRCLENSHCIKQFAEYLQEIQPREERQANSELLSLISRFSANWKDILQEPHQTHQIIPQPQSTQSHSQKQDSKQLRMRRIETNQTQNHHYLQDSMQEDVWQRND